MFKFNSCIANYSTRGVVYCFYIGNITRYEVEDYGYGGALHVIADGLDVLCSGKASASRLYSCAFAGPLHSEKEHAAVQYEKWFAQSKREYEKIRSINERIFIETRTTDSRVVRAYILSWYEVRKKTAIEDISALLNSSLDWNVEEAGEWLVRNGFWYSKENIPVGSDDLKGYHYSFADIQNDKYIMDSSKLKDPYWKPQRH